MHMNAFARRDQKRIWDTLELELPGVVSFVVLLLGIELGASVQQYVLLAAEPSPQDSLSQLITFQIKEFIAIEKNMD